MGGPTARTYRFWEYEFTMPVKAPSAAPPLLEKAAPAALWAKQAGPYPEQFAATVRKYTPIAPFAKANKSKPDRTQRPLQPFLVDAISALMSAKLPPNQAANCNLLAWRSVSVPEPPQICASVLDACDLCVLALRSLGASVRIEAMFWWYSFRRLLLRPLDLFEQGCAADVATRIDHFTKALERDAAGRLLLDILDCFRQASL